LLFQGDIISGVGRRDGFSYSAAGSSMQQMVLETPRPAARA
jgi:hypothetical protein